MARMKIIFDGFTDLADAIDRAGGDMHAAVDEALDETFDIVKANLIPAAAVYDRKGLKGYASGDMYRTIIKDGAVQWSGMTASIRVGFSISQKGGWHSIFVMYGTPRMAKDQNVYNAIKGARTKKEIAEKQQEIMRKHLDLAGG